MMTVMALAVFGFMAATAQAENQTPNPRSVSGSANSMLATRVRAGFLGGSMNLGGNIVGITVPIIVGFIVQITGSYLLVLMFFAAAGVALFACSTAIDYGLKLPV